MCPSPFDFNIVLREALFFNALVVLGLIKKILVVHQYDFD